MDNFALSPAELLDQEVPSATTLPVSSDTINAKSPFLPQQLILLFNHDQWEEFIREWAHFQKSQYSLVVRLGGANDYGIDVAAFKSNKGFSGLWDNFQCKHYKVPLAPATALLEAAKIIWHSFEKRISVPENYFFFAPKDCGESLKRLLLNSESLKKRMISEWDKNCSTKITKSQQIKLEGSFKLYVEAFDFNIFQYKPSLEVIEEHRKTPYFTARFGGGLTGAPENELAPITPAKKESRYVEQLLEAYSDCGVTIETHEELVSHPKFQGHFSRSRQTFYDAEALVSFARDTVPNGTFESLQDEVFHGVKDVEEDDHNNAFDRVKEVTKTASTLNVSANGLAGVTTPKRLRGICHQLANNDKLVWRKK
ncbi:ABC-three component system protein [Pseudovibrio sp. Ad46]|uniref:ABC-three component system protein n=1 Tax=Pseudovibrio sp. Ad46 TaxID=989432 RepID=UPI0007AED06E|nr:ABC-three component system protein [Pseudovibrio sp. Ad46]